MYIKGTSEYDHHIKTYGEDFKYEDFELVDYVSHPTLKGVVAV